MAGGLIRVTPERVFDVASDRMAGPIVYGRNDCCTGACDAHFELYGIDPMAPIRGRYGDKRSGAILISQNGGFMTLGHYLAREAGLVECQERTGAIGISARGKGAGPEHRGIAICVEPGIWLGKGERGAVLIGEVAKCWGLPF